MLSVRFSPLYSFNNLKNNPDILSPTATGVYVWGFKFKKPQDPSGLSRFLPYYVGKAQRKTILQRLTSHYNFKENCTIFKPQYLPEYFNYLQSDTTVKYMSPGQYEKYKQMFAYLKTGNILLGASGNNGKAINQLQQKRSEKNIASAIQYYQDNFYACWIIVPTDGYNPIIPSLEKHISFHFPHSYVTSNAEHNSLFGINEEALGEDRFLL